MVVAPSNENTAPEATFEVTNPATGEVITTLPQHDAEHVQAEMARVRVAARAWGALPVPERCRRMARVRDVIASRADELAETVRKENGKPRQDSYTLEVMPTLLTMTYFIENAPRILQPERLHLAFAKHRRSYLSFQPKGVIGVITPWNFPVFMPGGDVAMALIAGNGALLKPSEVTPMSALLLKECYDEGGIDPNLFRVVTGLGPTGAALIDAMPDHLVFTGSVPTGRRIGVACAERFIPYTLELGGKAPLIALDDADIERTANAIVWGGFVNAGQVCASVERVYADASIHDTLVDRVTRRVGELRVGDPGKDDEVEMGPLTFPRQREIVDALVTDAREKGARVLAGGKAIDGPGLFYEPTILADCTHDMKVMKEEIFGPVVPFMKVTSERQALELANDSHLGLGGYVFTRDPERGRRVAEQLEVGSVQINSVVDHAGWGEMPWGGIKQSGLGVVRSDRGLKELCHARHINEDRLPVSLDREPYWFPYSKKTESFWKNTIKNALGGTVAAKVARFLIK